MKIWFLVWNVCNENKRLLVFIVLLLMCLVVVLSDVFCLMFYFNVSVYLIIMIFQRFGVGIGLLLIIIDLIDLSVEEDYE